MDYSTVHAIHFDAADTEAQLHYNVWKDSKDSSRTLTKLKRSMNKIASETKVMLKEVPNVPKKCNDLYHSCFTITNMNDPYNSYRASNLRKLLVLLFVAFTCQNMIAPNMNNIAQSFNYSEFERLEFIGSGLATFFYIPGTLGAVFSGLLPLTVNKCTVVCILAFVLGIVCFATSYVGNYVQLACFRAIAGFMLGALTPLSYQLIAEWFLPAERPSASARMLFAAGLGVFIGHCVATVIGSWDWRTGFLLVSLPMFVVSLLTKFLEIPQDENDEKKNENEKEPDLIESSNKNCKLVKKISFVYSDTYFDMDSDTDSVSTDCSATECNLKSKNVTDYGSIPHLDIKLKSILKKSETDLTMQTAATSNTSVIAVIKHTMKKVAQCFSCPTTVCLLIHAFPGNVPLGALTIFLHDFIATDMKLGDSVAMSCIAIGVIFGAIGLMCGAGVGKYFYTNYKAHTLSLLSLVSIVRIIPYALIFLYPTIWYSCFLGPLLLYVLIACGGFLAFFCTATAGALLMNVNTKSTRGLAVAFHQIGEEASRALGSILVAVVVVWVHKAYAMVDEVNGSVDATKYSATTVKGYALTLTCCFWAVSSIALAGASYFYIEDEKKASASETDCASILCEN